MNLARGMGLRGRIVVAMFAASWGCSSLVQAEIPANREIPTGRDHHEQEVKFFTRVLLDPYLENRANEQPELTDADPAEEFLRLWISIDKDTLTQAQIAELIEKAKVAADAGCQDPAFIYCYGRSLGYAGTSEECVKHVTTALENLDKNGYSNALSSMAAKFIATVLPDLQRQFEAEAAGNLWLEWLAKTVENGPFEPDDQRLIFSHMQPALEKYPIEKIKPVVEKIDAHLYPWLKHMATAKLEIREAWKARGGGWASEVTEEGWKGFREHIEQGRDNYYEAWKLSPHWPEAATGLITVAMAGHGFEKESPRHWFDQAVAAEFDYHPAYDSMMWSLAPRWGGSHGELYEFGRECLRTGRFDTWVPYNYLNAFQRIVSDIGGSLEYYKAPGVYNDIQEVADGYLKESSIADKKDWFRTLKVAAAVRCEKWDEARKFLDAVGDNPDPNAYGWLGLSMDESVTEILARTGEHGESMAEADRLAAAGDYAQAKAKFEDLASNEGTEQRVTTYYRGRARGLEFDANFEAGEWTPLPLDEKLTGWRNVGGNWSLDDQGRLVGETQKNGFGLLFERKLGTRFELRGTALVLKKPYSQCNFGVYFGQHNGTMPNSFRLFVDDDEAAVLKGNKAIEKRPIDIEMESTFRVVRWDNAITGYVNDELVARKVEIEPYGPPESEVFALGGRYWYPGPVICFTGLEIRKLTQEPVIEEPAAAEPPAEEPAAPTDPPTDDAAADDATAEEDAGEAEASQQESSEGDAAEAAPQ